MFMHGRRPSHRYEAGEEDACNDRGGTFWLKCCLNDAGLLNPPHPKIVTNSLFFCSMFLCIPRPWDGLFIGENFQFSLHPLINRFLGEVQSSSIG